MEVVDALTTDSTEHKCYTHSTKKKVWLLLQVWWHKIPEEKVVDCLVWRGWVPLVMTDSRLIRSYQRLNSTACHTL